LGFFAAMTVAIGVMLLGYAALLLPDEFDRGGNPLDRDERAAQLVLAVGVFVAGVVGLRSREVVPRLAAVAVATVSLATWVVAFVASPS
jgi:hypothetical protein